MRSFGGGLEGGGGGGGRMGGEGGIAAAGGPGVWGLGARGGEGGCGGRGASRPRAVRDLGFGGREKCAAWLGAHGVEWKSSQGWIGWDRKGYHNCHTCGISDDCASRPV